MKNICVLIAFLFANVLFAQDNDASVKVERVSDNTVKVITFHQNGQIAQTGFVKNKKLDGKWESFDASGERVSSGNYSAGQKVGQWFFWNEDQLTEVDFNENKVTSVNLWQDSKSSIASK